MALRKKLESLVMFLGSFAISCSGFAGIEPSSMKCAGKAWMISVFGPIPFYRDIKLDLVQPHSQATIDIGGSPLVYQGPLDLSGHKEQVMTNEHSGDRVVFKITLMDSSHIKFVLDFKSAKGNWQGHIFPAILSCDI